MYVILILRNESKWLVRILVKIISIQTNLSFEESLGFDKLDNQGGHYARLVVWTFFGN